MTGIKTKHLVKKLAKSYQKQKETFSKEEIVTKINEIKVLSAYNKVPKFTLRKEIIHLEKKLEGVFEMEKSLLKEKKQENIKITALKRQITLLKKRLNAAEDKDLRKKVDKLTHILGDYLAMDITKMEVKSSKKKKATKTVKEKEVKKPVKKISGTSKEIKKKATKKKTIARKKSSKTSKKVIKKTITIEETQEITEMKLEKMQAMQNRLELLRHELDINKALEKDDPEKFKVIEEKVKLIETKLEDFSKKNLTCSLERKVDRTLPIPPPSAEGEIKHDILFKPEGSIIKKHEKDHEICVSDEDVDDELPLPPPPKTS